MTIDCTLIIGCRSLLTLCADLIHSDLRPFLLLPQYKSCPFKKIDEVEEIEKYENEKSAN